MHARLAALAFVALFFPGCGHRAPAAPATDVARRLGADDELVGAGCLDCLLAASRDAHALLEAVPTDGIASVAERDDLLVAIRQHQLGLAPDASIDRARAVLDAHPALQAEFAPLLQIVDTLPPASGGARQIDDDRQLGSMRRAYAERSAWRRLLGARANGDVLSASLLAAFECAYDDPEPSKAERVAGAVGVWGETPLLAFEIAICGAPDGKRLDALAAADPRFVETEYYLGLRDILAGRLDTAGERFRRAVIWRPEWAAALYSLGNVALAAEDYPRAADSYERALAVEPARADAMLGDARALVYAGRYAAAVAAADRLLAGGRWYVGDAHYWRAAGETRLGQLDAAWADIQAADRLLLNADVPKLAGIIAAARGDIDVAREKFALAHARDPSDCETAHYLGLVMAQQHDWPQAADALHDAGRCLDGEDQRIEAEIARLRREATAENPRALQIAHRERELASIRRLMPPTWYNAAVSCFNLGRMAEARADAERVRDGGLAGPAKALLARLPQ